RCSAEECEVMKLAVIVSALRLTATPASAGSSQGRVSRLYQSTCYPGVGCWLLGYQPAILGSYTVWRGLPPPRTANVSRLWEDYHHRRTGFAHLLLRCRVQPGRHKACETFISRFGWRFLIRWGH